MTSWQAVLIFTAGIASGFLNVVGGGGSLISLPVLIFAGLPAAEANGTNRIALMVQSLVAVSYFRQKGFFYPKLSLILGLPAVLGSVLGARFAISLPDEVFNRILASVMLAVTVIIILQPEKLYVNKANGMNTRGWTLALTVLLFFGIGFYGGFIQAGVGFVIIAALSVITGLSLVGINSLKLFITFLFVLFSLLVFVQSGNVNWLLGLVLALGNAIGAYLGSVFSVARGDRWIRAVLVVTVLFMSAKLLFFS